MSTISLSPPRPVARLRSLVRPRPELLGLLALAALLNLWALGQNGVRGRSQAVRHHVLGALVFVITLALTSGALAMLHALSPHPGRLLEAAVLVVASACATVTRYVGLSSWVFPGPASSARSAASVTGQSPP